MEKVPVQIAQSVLIIGRIGYAGISVQMFNPTLLQTKPVRHGIFSLVPFMIELILFPKPVLLKKPVLRQAEGVDQSITAAQMLFGRQIVNPSNTKKVL